MTLEDPSKSPEWQALVDHAAATASVHLRQLFADDPDRARRLTLTAGDMRFDFSKHRVTDETIRLLPDLHDPSTNALIAALLDRRPAR